MKDYSGEILTASIVETNGQYIRNLLLNSSYTDISISDLANGVYLLLLNDKEGNILLSEKIIRE